MANKQTVAGSSPMPVDPKVPVYKTGSKYNLVEKTNEGPSQGKGRKTEAKGHGQDSDVTSDKDKLVGYTLEQRDPYRTTGNDFKDGHAVSAAHGQSTGAEKLNNDTEQKNQLAWYTPGQEGPRRMEDGFSDAMGSGAPVPGDRGAVVARNFPIMMNSGESGSSGGQIPIAESVNLQTGHIECAGSRTQVMEVPEEKVSIATKPTSYPKAGLEFKNK